MPSATEDTDDSVHQPEIKAAKWDKKSTKSVSYDEYEGISPLMLAKSKEVDDFDLDGPARRVSTSKGKKHRLTTRQGLPTNPAVGWWQAHVHRERDAASLDGPAQSAEILRQASSSHEHGHHHHGVTAVIDEVVAWLHAEKAKKKARKVRAKTQRAASKQGGDTASATSDHHFFRPRHSSDASNSSMDLEELECILEKGGGLSRTTTKSSRKSSVNLQRYASRSARASLRRRSTVRSSDTEYVDDDILVPSCDVNLDNSATLTYFDDPNAQDDLADPELASKRDREAWSAFKYEIVRLAHTLKLRGWRRVPLERADETDVQRLSGALTNAVYVVTPPLSLPDGQDESDSTARNLRSNRGPLKLLLRIYGPNVEHLIDRDAELQILRRLARQKIGPRLLGTFENGRFEEYYNANPLTPSDLRNPETSKQIAKRMRELHDGIELLEEELDGGPFVWKNWDKWVDRAEKITKHADRLVLAERERRPSVAAGLRRRGLLCGTSWPFFRQTVERYRKYLEEAYGGPEKMRDQLVFAHNDTQYGNILRREPSGESPLLLPANEHKQLVVIDFEYANANPPGMEFANHFTEWCYNYHDATASYACNVTKYPTPEEQYRFLRAYSVHRPQYTPAASSPPSITPIQSVNSLTKLTLAARHPPKATETYPRDHLTKTDSNPEVTVGDEIKRLMHETRLWRIANSAQWTVWGILQAKIPGMNENLEIEHDVGGDDAAHSDTEDSPDDDESGDTEENNQEEAKDQPFDYLSYARDRAMFFWGDCLQVKLVTEEELGEEVMAAIKILKY